MRRVVVTGIGMVSPLAPSAEESWSRLLNCESGVRQIVSFDVSDLASKVAGQVPTAETAPNASTLFDPLKYVTTKELGRVDLVCVGFSDRCYGRRRIKWKFIR